MPFSKKTKDNMKFRLKKDFIIDGIKRKKNDIVTIQLKDIIELKEKDVLGELITENSIIKAIVNFKEKRFKEV